MTYDTLRDEIQKRVLRECSGEMKSIEASDIWRVEILFDRVYVFFETDEQKNRHQDDNVCGSIRRKLDAIAERHDPFGHLRTGYSACSQAARHWMKSMTAICFTTQDRASAGEEKKAAH